MFIAMNGAWIVRKGLHWYVTVCWWPLSINSLEWLNKVKWSEVKISGKMCLLSPIYSYAVCTLFSVHYILSMLFALSFPLCYVLIILFTFFIIRFMFIFLFCIFCLLFYVFCVFLYCFVYCFSPCVSFLFVCKFTDCHRMETQLHSINIYQTVNSQ
jgi:hypothetical protein